jgi:hypothetical protein
MTADKRNATVVIALVLAMTVGAQVLLSFESWFGAPPTHWEGDVRLSAERGNPVQHVEISYITKLADLDELGLDDHGRDSVCVIGPAGEVDIWRPAGPRVRLMVIGSSEDRLPDEQKRTLLATLGSLSEASGVDLVRVRIASGSDVRRNPDLPMQAHDLRELLVRKKIIR